MKIIFGGGCHHTHHRAPLVVGAPLPPARCAPPWSSCVLSASAFHCRASALYLNSAASALESLSLCVCVCVCVCMGVCIMCTSHTIHTAAVWLLVQQLPGHVLPACTAPLQPYVVPLQPCVSLLCLVQQPGHHALLTQLLPWLPE